SMADLILPEHNYLEDWGNDIPDPGPGYQVVGFQQPVVAPVHDTRAFADILLEVGRRIGAPAGLPPDVTLPWDTFRDLLREGAGQLQQLRRGSVTDANPEAFWNKVLQQGGWWDASVKHGASPPAPPRLPGQGIPPRFDGDPGRYPLSLVPFPSHSLGDGDGAHLPWLQATPDPVTTVGWQTWVEVSRGLAQEADLQEGDVVSVESSQGSIEAWVYVNPALPPGVVAVPMGQGHSGLGRYTEGRGSNVFAILAPLEDEATGALAWAATRVRLVKTGRKQRMPKFEGTMFPAQLAGSEIIEVTH
ncbi:MAG: 4Fe-4S ferredoxin, partial [Chloroflexi bacterium]|nr:4Fe-4S ferredoxin [Chloroflexota bacterium]